MDEYLTIRRAAAELGIHPESLKRKAYRGELGLYRDGRDARRRYVRRADVAALTEIRPVTRKHEATAATRSTAS